MFSHHTPWGQELNLIVHNLGLVRRSARNIVDYGECGDDSSFRNECQFIRCLADTLKTGKLIGLIGDMPDQTSQKFEKSYKNLVLLRKSVNQLYRPGSTFTENLEAQTRKLVRVISQLETQIREFDKPKLVEDLLIFIGSSTNANGISNGLCCEFEKSGLTASHWSSDMRFGASIWDGVQRNIEGSHAGVFVFHPDDIIFKKDTLKVGTRGNVLIEFGLATGVLEGHGYFAVPRNISKENVDIDKNALQRVGISFDELPPILEFDEPSDLRGIHTARYDHSRIVDISTKDEEINQLANKFLLQFLENIL